MAVTDSFAHPTFKELNAIAHAEALFADPSDSDFNKCRGTNKDSSSRCGNRIKTTKANLLWKEFRDKSDGFEMGSFVSKLEEFIRATYCFRHVNEALEKFDKWKQLRVPAVPSSAAPSATGEKEQSIVVESVCDTGNTSISSLTPNDATLDKPTLAYSEASDKADGIANGISTLKISDGSHLRKSDVKQFVELGITSLQRTGSLRDNSPVITELYKPLTARQQQDGIVYILRHDNIDNLFKIGWTTTSADEKRRQSGNCYGTDSQVIHESQAKFFGAMKAGRLAQVIFRHDNIRVTECKQCNRGHRGWFQIPEEEVRRAVRLMEDLVRLPGYTMQKGEMRLSPAAHSLIQGMSGFSPEKLEALMGRVEEQKEDDTSPGVCSDTITITDTRATDEDQPPRPGADNAIPGIHPNSSQSVHIPEEMPKHQMIESAKKWIGKAIGGARRSLGRSDNTSRQSISAPSQKSADEGLEATVKGSVTRREFEEGLTGFLWSLIPDVVKVEEDDTGRNSSKTLPSLKNPLSQGARKLWDDLKVAYQEKVRITRHNCLWTDDKVARLLEDDEELLWSLPLILYKLVFVYHQGIRFPDRYRAWTTHSPV